MSGITFSTECIQEYIYNETMKYMCHSLVMVFGCVVPTCEQQFSCTIAPKYILNKHKDLIG